MSLMVWLPFQLDASAVIIYKMYISELCPNFEFYEHFHLWNEFLRFYDMSHLFYDIPDDYFHSWRLSGAQFS